MSTLLSRPNLTTPASALPSVFLEAGWYHLVMLNYLVKPEVLEPWIPKGTELDFFAGQTYLSIVGFQFHDVKVLGVPIPFHSRFAEVNLRFYVRRRVQDELRRGVVFVKEIAPKRCVTWIARWLYNENYVTLPMREQVTEPNVSADGSARYEWFGHQRWQSVHANYRGEPTPLVPGSREEFILEHYFGYTKQRDGSTLEYQVEHAPWRVWQTTTCRLDAECADLYGPSFAAALTEPSFALVADGSPIRVRKGVRIA